MSFRHVLICDLIYCRKKLAHFISTGDRIESNSTWNSTALSISGCFSNWRTQKNSSAVLTRISQCFETEIWRLWGRKWFILSCNPRSALAPQWFQLSTLYLYHDKTKLVLLGKLSKKKVGWGVTSPKGVTLWTRTWFFRLLNQENMAPFQRNFYVLYQEH